MKKTLLSIFCFIILFSTNAFSQEFNSLIQNYLDEKATELNLQSSDVNDWIVTNQVFSKRSKVTNVYIQQTYNGIPIFNAVGVITIKDNEVLFANNSFLTKVSTKINSITATLTSKNAIEKSAIELGLNSLQDIELLEEISENEYVYSNSGISNEKIPVKLVYQPMPDGTLKLAWELSVLQRDMQNWWNVRIDASSGKILDKNDYFVKCNFPSEDHNHINDSENHLDLNMDEALLDVSPAVGVTGDQYNVFAIPVESPNHGSRSIVVNPSDATASPYGWHDDDGIAGAEYTYTRGNNVYAQDDINGDDEGTGFGSSPDGTSALNFDFSLNLNQEASGYLDASLTNLFYMNNIVHDVLYQYGFDEEAGNFQTNNYGAAGLGDDAVIADGQDGSGTNNANFGTPPDGSNPRMQMFLWDGPTLVRVNGGTLQGDYGARDSNFGGVSLISVGEITADLVIVDDGTGLPTEGCDPLTNGADVSGKIAVIRRGNCDFTQKVQNAQDAGAIGVVVVNNVASPLYVVMGGDTNTVTIPAVSMTQADGEALITAIEGGETINTTLVPSPDFDGSFDNGIIAHEYGHGISNRLIGGGSNTSCMNNDEQLGEGWSDFFALMLTMKNSDTADDARGIGTFASGEETDGIGIRQYKYSPDMSVNPFTFADVEDQWFTDANDIVQTSVHGVGSIWATMLWDLNWFMIGKHGFDPDVYNGTGGNNMTMELVMEGLKMTPCSSGFKGARDAIINADIAINGGDNYCLIWEVFARRGLGTSASSGDADSIYDQTTSFSYPRGYNGEACGSSLSLSVEDESNPLMSVYPNPSNGLISIRGINTFEDVKITIIDVNGRSVYSNELKLEENTRIDASSLKSGFYLMNIKGDEVDQTIKLILE